MNRRLEFRYDRRKFMNAAALLLKAGVTEPTMMKIFKLVYMADKEHLLRYGRPIVGDRYVCMNKGPVPSKTFDALKDMRNAEAPTEPIAVRQWSQIVANGEPNLDVFSQSDLSILAEVVEKYGGMSADQLSELSHDKAWHCADRNRRPGSSRDMPWETFFGPQDSDLLDAIRESQDA